MFSFIAPREDHSHPRLETGNAFPLHCGSRLTEGVAGHDRRGISRNGVRGHGPRATRLVPSRHCGSFSVTVHSDSSPYRAATLRIEVFSSTVQTEIRAEPNGELLRRHSASHARSPAPQARQLNFVLWQTDPPRTVVPRSARSWEGTSTACWPGHGQRRAHDMPVSEHLFTIVACNEKSSWDSE